ncbi:hypothetical protein AVEN_47884-1 [Araneus ventricosus]|uniref:Uncharacterized protein n=1 Tax=Araneus ventricosus TaxID=182803 RepID=A0A4Y2US29_ARAVE|nr:hypothetical protein AVEN_47884-1 [Araneus ventricosus]
MEWTFVVRGIDKLRNGSRRVHNVVESYSTLMTVAYLFGRVGLWPVMAARTPTLVHHAVVVDSFHNNPLFNRTGTHIGILYLPEQHCNFEALIGQTNLT